MDITKAPFLLNKDDVRWVEETLSSMTLEEKIGQLFCPIGYSTEKGYLEYELLRKHIGGLFFRSGEAAEMQSVYQFAQDYSKIPLLIPSNLEAGGDGAATDGTSYGKQMEVAAANDKKYAYRLGKISCSEGRALGVNWAFAPVVDIDMNYRNPITNVRTFGDNPDRIIEYAKEYLRAAKEENVAVSIKHFPGDGVDERDQHLLTSVNSLSMEEWRATFGKVYRELIKAGAQTVMVGHIALPGYFTDDERNEGLLPASLSKKIIGSLLREELDFNGLIVTDATPMVGFCTAMPREIAVPYSIECGCDMFLFNKDLSEDYEFMKQGVERGILSMERLDQANKRILALKASLGLHRAQLKKSLVPGTDDLAILKCEDHVAWARELALKSITLVKDTQELLPIHPTKHHKVLLEILGDFPSNERVLAQFSEAMKARGYEITLYEPEDFSKPLDHVSDIKAKYDLVIYLGNVENASNKTTNRINWYTFFGSGNNIPWFVHEVPTLFISLANPYHLFDVPMIKTYINCYSNNEYIIESVIAKIHGEQLFEGISPIDPFCNLPSLAIS